MDRWVKAGNVILVEEQSMASIPVQSAYDPFTYGGENLEQSYPVEVSEKGPIDRMSQELYQVYRTLDLPDHPVVEELPEIVSLERATLYMKDWFPDRYTAGLPSLVDYHSLRRRMYVGWFESYSDEWDPLLFADEDRERPILLCRFVEGDDDIGAYVLTTMYLGSAEQTRLVRNIIDLPQTAPEYLEEREFRRKEQRRIWLRRAAIALGIVMATIAFVVGYLTYDLSIRSIGSTISVAVLYAVAYVLVEKFLVNMLSDIE